MCKLVLTSLNANVKPVSPNGEDTCPVALFPASLSLSFLFALELSFSLIKQKWHILSLRLPAPFCTSNKGHVCKNWSKWDQKWRFLQLNWSSAVCGSPWTVGGREEPRQTPHAWGVRLFPGQLLLRPPCCPKACSSAVLSLARAFSLSFFLFFFYFLSLSCPSVVPSHVDQIHLSAGA